MPDSLILADFGASRIKCVRWSWTEQRITASAECAAPSAIRGASGEVEFDPEAYWIALEQTAGALAQQDPQVQDLWLCAEMHGFVLVAPTAPSALTPYISWQDQRASHAAAGSASTLDRLMPQAALFLQHTGMCLRAGLPAVSLAHLTRQGVAPVAARFASLVDWLLIRGGEAAPRSHATMAAGTGLFSLVDRAWRPQLLAGDGAHLSGLLFPTLATPAEPIGTIRLAGRGLRVWGGVGDMQAAAHGSGFAQASDVLINLGTGSQVMAQTPEKLAGVDRRISAAGSEFHAVTHIPSGRALNVFAAFLDECAALGGGAPIFWKLFSELQAQEVLQANAQIDLNVFEAAWKFSNGGHIGGILEHQFDPRSLVCDIAAAWLRQYPQALQTMAPLHAGPTYLLAGGLSRRADFIPVVLEKLLGRACILPTLRTGEDTLDGLLQLAEARRGAAPEIPKLPLS